VWHPSLLVQWKKIKKCRAVSIGRLIRAATSHPSTQKYHTVAMSWRNQNPFHGPRAGDQTFISTKGDAYARISGGVSGTFGGFTLALRSPKRVLFDSVLPGPINLKK